MSEGLASDFLAALQQEPERNYLFYDNFRFQLRQARALELAEQAFSAAEPLCGENPDFHYFWGISLWETGSWQDGLNHLLSAVRLSRLNWIPMHGTGFVLGTLASLGLQVPTLRFPYDSQDLEELLQSLQQSDFARSRELLTKAVAERNQLLRAFIPYWTGFLEGAARFREIRKFFEEHIDIFSEIHFTYKALCLAYWETDDLEALFRIKELAKSKFGFEVDPVFPLSGAGTTFRSSFGRHPVSFYFLTDEPTLLANENLQTMSYSTRMRADHEPPPNFLQVVFDKFEFPIRYRLRNVDRVATGLELAFRGGERIDSEKASVGDRDLENQVHILVLEAYFSLKQLEKIETLESVSPFIMSYYRQELEILARCLDVYQRYPNVAPYPSIRTSSRQGMMLNRFISYADAYNYFRFEIDPRFGSSAAFTAEYVKTYGDGETSFQDEKKRIDSIFTEISAFIHKKFNFQIL